MYDKDVKPYSEYEMRLRNWEVRKAETREAQKALDDTILKAPFEGVMARKLVEEFENVLAKQAVLVMQNDALLEIKVSVPERDLAEGSSDTRDDDDLTAILKPRVVVSSLPGREFPARLKELATVADPTTRTFEATFRFSKPQDANIMGGMTAKVIVSIPETRAVAGVIIPSVAVVAGEEGGGSVWVIDPSALVASRREVTLGDLTGSRIEVTSGLAPGDVIAVSGVHQLRDGMTVRRLER
jgi:RND family efflux transporter MFP subunit